MDKVKINSCAKTYCSDNWVWNSINNITWSDYDLWIVIKGYGKLYTKDSEFNLKSGDCFILKPNEIYKASQDINNKLVIFHSHFEFINKSFDYEFYRNLCNFSNIIFLTDKLLNSYLCNSLDESLLWFKALLLEILNQDNLNKISKFNTNHNSIINEIIDSIQKNPEFKHTLSYYSGKYNYSNSYLGRIFKQFTASSFSQYTINVRLNKAKLLLHDTNLAIKQISDILGYTDTCFFSKQFKKFNDKTPIQYRKYSI